MLLCLYFCAGLGYIPVRTYLPGGLESLIETLRDLPDPLVRVAPEFVPELMYVLNRLALAWLVLEALEESVQDVVLHFGCVQLIAVFEEFDYHDVLPQSNQKNLQMHSQCPQFLHAV